MREEKRKRKRRPHSERGGTQEKKRHDSADLIVGVRRGVRTRAELRMERVVGEALEEGGAVWFVHEAEGGGEGVGVGAFGACDGDGGCGGATQACVWVDEVGVANAVDFDVLDVGA